MRELIEIQSEIVFERVWIIITGDFSDSDYLALSITEWRDRGERRVLRVFLTVTALTAGGKAKTKQLRNE